MKTLTGVIVGAVVVIAVIWGIVAYQKSDTQNDTSGANGSLYVGVTDASADIKNVDDINMSVKKVEVYSASRGWVTVSSNSKDYDLLTLKNSGEVKLYAKSDIPADTYSKVRVTLGDTNVKTKANGTVKATLPASQIVMNQKVAVTGNQTSQLKLDFLADKSLHVTGDGKSYVWAPVVASEAKSNTQVQSGSDDVITSTGGTTDSAVSVGVDLQGTSKPDYQLATDNTLQIKSSNNGILNFMLGGKSIMSDDTEVRENEGQVINVDLNANGALNTNSNTNTKTNTNSNTSGSTSGGLNLNTNTSGSLNLNY
jgi:hypothetical protein